MLLRSLLGVGRGRFRFGGGSVVGLGGRRRRDVARLVGLADTLLLLGLGRLIGRGDRGFSCRSLLGLGFCSLLGLGFLEHSPLLFGQHRRLGRRTVATRREPGRLTRRRRENRLDPIIHHEGMDVGVEVLVAGGLGVSHELGESHEQRQVLAAHDRYEGVGPALDDGVVLTVLCYYAVTRRVADDQHRQPTEHEVLVPSIAIAVKLARGDDLSVLVDGDAELDPVLIGVRELLINVHHVVANAVPLESAGSTALTLALTHERGGDHLALSVFDQCDGLHRPDDVDMHRAVARVRRVAHVLEHTNDEFVPGGDRDGHRLGEREDQGGIGLVDLALEVNLVLHLRAPRDVADDIARRHVVEFGTLTAVLACAAERKTVGIRPLLGKTDEHSNLLFIRLWRIVIEHFSPNPERALRGIPLSDMEVMGARERIAQPQPRDNLLSRRYVGRPPPYRLVQ